MEVEEWKVWVEWNGRVSEWWSRMWMNGERKRKGAEGGGRVWKRRIIGVKR